MAQGRQRKAAQRCCLSSSCLWCLSSSCLAICRSLLAREHALLLTLCANMTASPSHESNKRDTPHAANGACAPGRAEPLCWRQGFTNPRGSALPLCWRQGFTNPRGSALPGFEASEGSSPAATVWYLCHVLVCCLPRGHLLDDDSPSSPSSSPSSTLAACCFDPPSPFLPLPHPPPSFFPALSHPTLPSQSLLLSLPLHVCLHATICECGWGRGLIMWYLFLVLFLSWCCLLCHVLFSSPHPRPSSLSSSHLPHSAPRDT